MYLLCSDKRPFMWKHACTLSVCNVQHCSHSSHWLLLCWGVLTQGEGLRLQSIKADFTNQPLYLLPSWIPIYWHVSHAGARTDLVWRNRPTESGRWCWNLYGWIWVWKFIILACLDLSLHVEMRIILNVCNFCVLLHLLQLQRWCVCGCETALLWNSVFY